MGTFWCDQPDYDESATALLSQNTDIDMDGVTVTSVRRSLSHQAGGLSRNSTRGISMRARYRRRCWWRFTFGRQ